MLLNDNLKCQFQDKIEEAKRICQANELNILTISMEEIIVNINGSIEELEEYLDTSLYREWKDIYEQVMEGLGKFSGYIADDYGGCLNSIALNVRDDLDDIGEPDFSDKIDAAAQEVFEVQEQRKIEILDEILNIYD